MDYQQYRRQLRQEKIKARNSLTPEEREEQSELICRRILSFDEYQKAEIIMLYKYIQGEVQLTALERADAGERAGRHRQFAYPLCREGGEMLAVIPNAELGDEAFVRGCFGIPEPNPAVGRIIWPEEIDLLICPCTAFDHFGGRLGMGGGYYDRFLPRCSRASVFAAAFEVQYTDRIPLMPWDWRVDGVFTEKNYWRKET